MSTDLLSQDGLLSRDELSQRCGGVWSYVSASRLNLWLKCPLAFRLKYVDGVTTPISTAQFVGRQVHQALEHFYRHRQLRIALNAQQLVEPMTLAWSAGIEADGVRFDDAADERAHWKQTVDLVTTYLVQLTHDEPHPLAVETAIEAPLIDPDTGEDLGIPLIGVVDLVLGNPAGPVIVDFKTTSRGGEAAEIMHEIQLTSYAYLFRHATQQREGRLEIRNLVKTKTPKIEAHQFAARSDAHFSRLFAVIRSYLADIERGQFIFRPSLTCSSCDFRHTHCRTWTG